MRRCENSSQNLGCYKTYTLMSCQNDGRIYKSINIDWIGVGKHQNVRVFKKKWNEKMWDFITESGLMGNMYYYELYKWWKNL